MTEHTYYVMGQEVFVHGAEIEREDLGGDRDGTYPNVFLHVRYPGEGKTHRVPLGNVKVQGGLSALMDDLNERGILPDWFAEGFTAPPDDYD